MKKHFLTITAIVLTAGTLVFTGCKKDDTEAPEVTINGGDQTISLQGTYTELGATAKDDKDGTLTPTIEGMVDVNKAGTYVITYSATDAAGNVGEATRTVTVKNDAAAVWVGTYAGSETDVNGLYTYTHDLVVTASDVKNNRIWITPLADFANNKVYVDVTGNNLDIPVQIVVGVGTGTTASCDVHNRQTSGTGAKTSTGFTLTYNDAKVSPCSGSRTAVAATFIKK
ncbi:MAG TPA: immunoglobulin-like domain-containing protein [Bacteroidia bacterium]|jgi:hypothetical protein|nr:immunoglobulin-like domain-containing protein [Bacteroidia bacterium]